MNTQNRYIIALAAALGLLPAILDTTIVNIALVPIVNALKSDFNTVQWIVTGYFLANAATIAVAGYLGNRFGSKRLFLLGLALFTVSSLLCGLAGSETLLIAFRLLQGLGGGLMIPLGQAMAFAPFKPEERARAGAIIGVPLLLAPIFGPIIGGLMVDQLGWQSIFFINVPIGVLGLGLAAWILPADAPRPAASQGRFDGWGLVLSTLGVTALLYGFKLVTQSDPATVTPLNPRGAIYGWGYWPVWAFLGVGLALMIAFTVRALRPGHEPVVDLRLYAQRDFRAASLVNWANAMLAFGTILLLPVFFQQIRLPHLSALDTSLTLMPMAVALLVGTVIAARLFYQVGVRVLVMIGVVLLAVAAWQLTGLTPTSGSADIWPWLLLIGLGLAFTSIPVQTFAVQTLNGPALAQASSLFTASRFVFASIGAAILTTLFVQQTTAHATALTAAALHNLPAGATPDPNNPQVQAALAQLAAQAGTAGLNDVFTFVMVGTVVVLLFALLLPGRATQQAEQAAHAGTPSEVAGI